MKTKTNKTSAAKLTKGGQNGRFTHDDVACAAYCLWENEGRPAGDDWKHWFRAEELLRQADQRAEVRP